MANKPKITATSVEEFNRLNDLYEALDKSLKDTIEEINTTILGTIRFIHKPIYRYSNNRVILIKKDDVKGISMEVDNIIVVTGRTNNVWHVHPIEGEGELKEIKYNFI